MTESREELEAEQRQAERDNLLQLETSPGEMVHFFSGSVWRDFQKVFDEALEKGLNELSDLDLRDPMMMAQSQGRIYQIKWLRSELRGYMIGIAEGLIPE